MKKHHCPLLPSPTTEKKSPLCRKPPDWMQPSLISPAIIQANLSFNPTLTVK